jgi:hypothetical protein
MIHHDEHASSAQQMPDCLHQLWQGNGEFVPRYRLLRVWVQAPMAHRPVGRITHHGTEPAGGEERRGLAHVTLDDPYTVLQAITDHILPREPGQRALQLQTDAAQVRETTRQEERHHAAARAEVDKGGRRWCGHKVCQ